MDQLDPEITTIQEARNWIDKWADDGLDCPACDQHVQTYWRTINATMARAVVQMYRIQRNEPGRFIHIPTEVGRQAADFCLLRFWGLTEELDRERADGGRGGHWKLTPKGMAWARGDITVPRYVVLLVGEPVEDMENPTSYSKSGQPKPDVSVDDALGDKFDRRKLMAGEA